MPTRERRQKEALKRADRDGDYAQIDCSYVLSNAGFQAMPALWQYAEVLAWIRCFQQRRDTLKPDELVQLWCTIGARHVQRQCKISAKLVQRGCWELLPDGGIKVLRVKEKRPNFPWKEKGQIGQNEGKKGPHSNSILHREGNVPLSGGPCPPSPDEVELEPTPPPKPTISVTAEFKRIRAERDKQKAEAGAANG